jgi:predicted acetyltransferase
MIYRRIVKDEIPLVADIQARAFRQDVEERIRRYRERGRPDWTGLRLLENDQEQPVAALAILERNMSLNGGDLPAGLVGSVAVPPDQRRRGYARQLMSGALQELYEKTLPCSLLFPFSIQYYRRLGYALVNMNWFLDVAPDHMPDYPERLAVRRATAEDRIAIQECYTLARRDRGNNGWLARTDWEWENRVWREGREAVVCPHDGEVEGYLLYELSWTPAERPIKVAEWVTTSDASWRGLVGFLSSLRDQATVLRYNAPQKEPLLVVLDQPYSAVGGSAEFVFFQAARLVTGFMLRIVHLAAALSARCYPPELKAELLLRVDDSQLPANGQPVHVHIADGTASVAPARGLFPGGPPTGVETDIATFSQLFAGAISAEQARAAGRLRADDGTCALLTTAFAAEPLYMHRSDWF